MGWIVAGAAVVGPAHRHAGRGCEDACKVVAPAAGVLIAAVADGAGSAARAADGAACVVAAACAAIQTWWLAQESPSLVAQLTDDVAYTWLAGVRTAVEALAAAEGIALGDLAATCLVVIADVSGVLAIQVGDGAIAIRAPVADGGGWSPLTWPLRGEYANETVFITSDEWHDTAQVVRSRPCAAVALFSDGFEVLALNYRERRVNAHLLDPLADYLCTVAAGTPPDQSMLDAAMAGYLANAAFDAHAFDDRTLVLACHVQAGP